MGSSLRMLVPVRRGEHGGADGGQGCPCLPGGQAQRRFDPAEDGGEQARRRRVRFLSRRGQLDPVRTGVAWVGGPPDVPYLGDTATGSRRSAPETFRLRR